MEVTKVVLETGSVSVDLEDEMGNTLLLHLEHLLRRKLFDQATHILQLLLTQSPDVNHVNKLGRSLLTYSVTYGDATAEMTRMLLNHGARVWPEQEVSTGKSDIIDKLKLEREQSAFTWILRSLMDGSVELEECDETIHLLCVAMADQPARMKRHVTRIMLQLGKVAVVNGPLFLQLKMTMMPYWAKPQELRFQCLRRIRKSLGPKRLHNLTKQLPLPKKLQRYVSLEERLHSRVNVISKGSFGSNDLESYQSEMIAEALRRK